MAERRSGEEADQPHNAMCGLGTDTWNDRRSATHTSCFYATGVSILTIRTEDWAMASANTAHRLPLLARMANDIERRGSMRSSTAAAMWAAYAAHTALTAWALARQLSRAGSDGGSHSTEG